MSKSLCVALLSAWVAGCATPQEPTLCELAARYPELRDPVVSSMFGLPTAGCLIEAKGTGNGTR